MACCAGDVDLVGGGVRCKILGQSGKIMIELIGNKTEGNFNDTNEDRLSFEVDEVKETDSQGQVVGKTGLKPHAVNSLAGQLFAFSKTDNVSYYQGMKALNVNLSAYLAGLQATLDIMVFLFLESGTVVSGNEAFSVYKGTVKFSIKVCLVQTLFLL